MTLIHSKPFNHYLIEVNLSYFMGTLEDNFTTHTGNLIFHFLHFKLTITVSLLI